MPSLWYIFIKGMDLNSGINEDSYKMDNIHDPTSR